MKLFSQRILESNATDTNPGNGIDRLGVTNHYTPIDNIISNVRNLFACHQGIVVDKGEDNVSLKLHSSKFISKEEIAKILYNKEIIRGTCMAVYIQQQGLQTIKLVNVGQYWIVYFCPNDIKGATKLPQPKAGQTTPEIATKCVACEELTQSKLEEGEMDTILESGEDEEMSDVTKDKLKEILQMTDKVRAAKQLELLVGQQMELPREYYFAGVKSTNGDESIALRWKYEKKVGKGKTAQITKSLINIYDETEDGVFVPDYDEDSMFELPDEVKKLIDNVLEFLGADKTDDPAIFSLTGQKKEDKDEDKDNKDSEKEENSKDSKDSEKEDNNSSEKDTSKKDDDDDLLK